MGSMITPPSPEQSSFSQSFHPLVSTVVQGTWSSNAPTIDATGFIYQTQTHTGAVINDEYTFKQYIGKGIYKVSISGTRNSNCGILTLSIDGTAVGTFDFYAASGVIVLTVDDISVTSSKLHTISCKVATKNASSSGYAMNLIDMQFLLKSA